MVSRMFYGRDPFQDLRRLHGDITRVLGAPMPAAEYPALNVYANQDGDYERRFTLAGDFDADNVEADFEDGVLRLTIPKAPEPEARRVQIRR